MEFRWNQISPTRPLTGRRTRHRPLALGSVPLFKQGDKAMNSILRGDCGKPTIEVEYNPNVLTRSEAVEAALLSHGFRPGQVCVIAIPRPYDLIGGST